MAQRFSGRRSFARGTLPSLLMRQRILGEAEAVYLGDRRHGTKSESAIFIAIFPDSENEATNRPAGLKDKDLGSA